MLKTVIIVFSIILVFLIIYSFAAYSFETGVAVILFALLVGIILLTRKTIFSAFSFVKRKTEERQKEKRRLLAEEERFERSIKEREKIFTNYVTILLENKANLLLFKENISGRYLQIQKTGEKIPRIELCITKNSLLKNEKELLSGMTIEWKQSSDCYTCIFGGDTGEIAKFLELLFINVFGFSEDITINPVILF